MLGKKKKKIILEHLEEALKFADFTHANFSKLNEIKTDLPKDESEVNEFIKNRIRIYVESWIKTRIQKAIDEIEVS